MLNLIFTKMAEKRGYARFGQALNSGFLSMKRLKESLLFSMRHKSTLVIPSIFFILALQFFGAYVYSCVEREAL